MADLTSRWLGLAAITIAVLGCNDFTGAEGLGVDEDAAEDGSAVSEGNAPQTPGPKALSCAYPLAESFGADEGQVLSSSIMWPAALPAGEQIARTVNVSDFYDCDGSKGIHGVMFITSKFNCAACAQESSTLESEKLHWDAQGLGIEVVELILNNPDESQPPTIESAQKWRDDFALYSVMVAPDNFSLVVGGSVGTPQMTIVDPRTMQVVMRQEGYAGPQQYQTLIDLATENKAAAGL